MIMFSEIEIWSISEIRHFEFSAIIENAPKVCHSSVFRLYDLMNLSLIHI